MVAGHFLHLSKDLQKGGTFFTDIDQSKLKGLEAGQMQSHFIEQQIYAKRKDDQSVGLGETHITEEDVDNQDYTSNGVYG